MESCHLLIHCEILNEMGILVSHHIRVTTHAAPEVSDLYMFSSRHIGHPLLICITGISPSAGEDDADYICEAEEVDETDHINGAFEETDYIFID
ncbi:DUF5952 family protein [Chitinophaga solisilvae]|uniref:DUF5952 family protein n=1 Tax=Chitinophaga solisilvae TaxID=1233460 RepID=UPI00136D22ED|nr:DUF5952 family protein [Chitinophaga solisilvae]